MIYMYSNDTQKSIDFYVALGFTLHSDDLDGARIRRARLSHPDCGQMLIALENYPELLMQSELIRSQEYPPLRTALTIVSDDYDIWRKRLRALAIEPSLSIIEPYGVWLYYHDPAKNLICVTNTSIW